MGACNLYFEACCYLYKWRFCNINLVSKIFYVNVVGWKEETLINDRCQRKMISKKCQVKGQLIIMNGCGCWRSIFLCSFSIFGCFCFFVSEVCLMVVIQWSGIVELIFVMEQFHSYILVVLGGRWVKVDWGIWWWLVLEILWWQKMVALMLQGVTFSSGMNNLNG